MWEDRNVHVCDNTKARTAFASFSGLLMSGNKEGRTRGYHVAHVWERVYDPECFTAGWNLCLMPGFLKLFTERQDRIPLLHQVIQQAAFDLYFKNGTPRATDSALCHRPRAGPGRGIPKDGHELTVSRSPC